MNNKKLATYGLIIAMYVALTLPLGTFSFGMVQCRISEVLMLLCLSKKEYILPLTLACFISNIIGFALGFSLPLDFLFGTLGTFVSCIMVYCLKDILWFKLPILALIMPVFVNAFFVGMELTLYESVINDLLKLFLINALYVGAGEFVSCTIFGLILYKPFMRMLDRIDEKLDI